MVKGCVNMTKYNKELVLSIGPYRTMRIAVIEAASFEECDNDLIKELETHPEVIEMNREEINKTIHNKV